MQKINRRTRLKALFLLAIIVWGSGPQQLIAARFNQPANTTSTARPGAVKNEDLDYASGNVTLHEDLLGVQGYSLSLKYNSEGVERKASTINEFKHTGVVGLGWALPEDRIIRTTNQTGNTLDDEYILNTGGSTYPLIYVGLEEDEVTKSYRVAGHQDWLIKHHTTSDQWEVVHEDGMKYIYGDGALIAHDSKSTEYNVRWGNWIGSSVAATDDSLSIGWNLSAKEDIFGDRVKFYYDRVDEQVGTNTIRHTRASYLNKIVGYRGKQIDLIYDEKSEGEYVDAHQEKTSREIDNDQDAYQERYEKKYLARVDLLSYDGSLQEQLELNYETLSPDQEKLKKRVLTEVVYKGADETVLHPSMKFDYYGLSTQDGVSTGLTHSTQNLFDSTTGALFGALKMKTTPQGGAIGYQYGKNQIGSSSREIDIVFPPAFTYESELVINDVPYMGTANWGAPKVFFGGDYVVAIFELQAYDVLRSRIRVYEWIGDRWVSQDMVADDTKTGEDRYVYDGYFYDNYRSYDFYHKSFLSNLRQSVMKTLGEVAPELSGMMNAFNDGVKDEIHTFATVGKDLKEGSVGKAIEDWFKGDFKVIEDVLADLFSSLITDLENIVDDVKSIAGSTEDKYYELQKRLYRKQATFLKDHPRKEYHVTLHDDFFSAFTTMGGSDVLLFSKDKLEHGKWNQEDLPIQITSRYVDVHAGDKFIAVLDELSDFTYLYNRDGKGVWQSQIVKLHLSTEDYNPSPVAVPAGSNRADFTNYFAGSTGAIIDGALSLFNSYAEDNQQRAKEHSKHRSSIAANNNFVVAVVTDSVGAEGQVHLIYHDEDMNWHHNQTRVDKKQTVFSGDADSQSLLETMMGKDATLALSTGNSFAALQVYDNLDAGFLQASDIPLEGTYIEQFTPDMHKFNATYGISWDENMSNIQFGLLHAGWGQDNAHTFISGDVVHKVTKAHDIIQGSTGVNNGYNYSFRFENGQFIRNSQSSPYPAKAFAPDVASAVIKNGSNMQPQFYQYNPNAVATGTSQQAVAPTLASIITGQELFISGVNQNKWEIIDNASQELIDAPDFVDDAVNLSFEVLNTVIQIIAIVIPVIGEFAAEAETLANLQKASSIVDKAGFVAMATQPVADELVRDIMGTNHKSTSISNNYISVNGKVFHRNPDGSWTDETDNAFTVDDYHTLVGESNSITGSHLNYTIKDREGIHNWTKILKNGKVYRTIAHTDLDAANLVIHNDSLTSVSGASAFLAYGPVDANGKVIKNSFRSQFDSWDAPSAAERKHQAQTSYFDATTVKLYKIADGDVEGGLSDYVVKRISVNDGYDTTYHHYQYDQTTAAYHHTSGGAIYPKVTEVPSGEAELSTARPNGETEHYFYNRYNYVNKTRKEGYPSSVLPSSGAAYVDLQSTFPDDQKRFGTGNLHNIFGRPYLVNVTNAEGENVSKTITHYKIWENDLHHLRNAQGELASLKEERIYPIRVVQEDHVLDGITHSTLHQYDNFPVRLRSTSTVGINALGLREEHKKEHVYAFERYPEMATSNQLTDIAYERSSVVRGSSPRRYLHAAASSYKGWNVNGGPRYAKEVDYVAKYNDSLSLGLKSRDYVTMAGVDVAETDASIASYENDVTDFEIKQRNFDAAVEAVRVAKEVTHTSFLELETTRHELHEELNDLAAELVRTQRDSEALRREKGVLQQRLTKYSQDSVEVVQQQGIVNTKHTAYTDAVAERKLARETVWLTGLSAFGPLGAAIAYGIEEGVENAKVDKAWNEYQTALTKLQQEKQVLHTAYKAVEEARGEVLELDQEKRALVATVKGLETATSHSLDDFVRANNASQRALAASTQAQNKINLVQDGAIIRQSHKNAGIHNGRAVDYTDTFLQSVSLLHSDIETVGTHLYRMTHEKEVTPDLYLGNGLSSRSYPNQRMVAVASSSGNGVYGFKSVSQGQNHLNVFRFRKVPGHSNRYNIFLANENKSLTVSTKGRLFFREHSNSIAQQWYIRRAGGGDWVLAPVYDARKRMMLLTIRKEERSYSFFDSGSVSPNLSIGMVASNAKHLNRRFILRKQEGATIQPYSEFATADLNGDGKTDLVYAKGNRLYYQKALANGHLDSYKDVGPYTNDMVLAPAKLGTAKEGIFVYSNSGARVLVAQKGNLVYRDIQVDGAMMSQASGWDKTNHVRTTGDVNGDGISDMIGFGDTSMEVYESKGSGQGLSYHASVSKIPALSIEAGGWRVGNHPRLIGDVNGDGLDDVIGMGQTHVVYYLAHKNDQGVLSFVLQTHTASNLTAAHGWHDNSSRRMLLDVNRDGKKDIVAIKDNGEVFVSFSKVRDGVHSFGAPILVQNNIFGANGASLSQASTWVVASGDFDGDGNQGIQAYRENVGNNGLLDYHRAEFGHNPEYNDVRRFLTRLDNKVTGVETRHRIHKANHTALQQKHEDAQTKAKQGVEVLENKEWNLGNKSQWIEHKRVLKRDEESGHVLSWEDAKKRVHSVSLNKNKQQTGVFSNADPYNTSGDGITLVYEDFEVDKGITVSTNEAHTGDRSHLVNTGSLSVGNNWSSDVLNQSYVLSAWVKPVGSTVNVHWENNGVQVTSNTHAGKNGWVYVEATVRGLVNPTLVGNVAMYVDDVLIRPLETQVSLSQYHPDGLLQAQMSNNGLEYFHYYLPNDQVLGKIDATKGVGAIQMPYYSREHHADTLNNAEPNAMLHVSFQGDGYISTDGVIPVSESGETDYALTFHAAGDFTLNKGNLSLSFTEADSTLTNEGTDQNVKLNKVAREWLVIETGNQAYVYADGKLLVSQSSASLSSNVGSSTGVDELLIGYRPIVTIAYQDGLGRITQQQRLVYNDQGVAVGRNTAETLYDGWGHKAVQTLHGESSDLTLGYNENFVTSYNWSTGVLTGDIKTYYQGAQASLVHEFVAEDLDYLYHQQTHTASPLARQHEALQPGQVFHANALNKNVMAYQSAVGTQTSTELAIQNANATTTTESDGVIKSSLKDVYGRVVGKKTGTQKTRLLYDYTQSGYEYNSQKMPNHYTAGNTGYTNYTKHLDLLGDQMEIYHVDEGKKMVLKDQLGNPVFNFNNSVMEEVESYINSSQLTFQLTGSLSVTGDVLPRIWMTSKNGRTVYNRTDPSVVNIVGESITLPYGKYTLHYQGTISNAIQLTINDESQTVESGSEFELLRPVSTAIQYAKYDANNRVVERGDYQLDFKGLNQLNTIVNAPFWDSPNAKEKSVYTYDRNDAGSSLNNKGRLTSHLHYQGDYVITHDYGYDIEGHMISDKVIYTNSKTNLREEKTTSYTYYVDGKVKQVTYPNGDRVNYSYDQYGRLYGVGTPTNKFAYAKYLYHLDSKVKQVVYGNQMQENRKYSLQNDLVSCRVQQGSNILFTETLNYFTGNRYADKKIVSYREQVGGSAANDYTYKYNGNEHLFEVARMSTGGRQTVISGYQYTYDANGNLLTDASSPQINNDNRRERTRLRRNEYLNYTIYNYTAGKNERTTLPTDKQGSVTTVQTPIWGATKVVYDTLLGKPVAFKPVDKTSSESVKLVYDAKNRRSMKVRNFTSVGDAYVDTTYYVHGMHALPLTVIKRGSLTSGGTSTAITQEKNLIYGKGFAPIAQKEGDEVNYFVHNYQGSLRAVYNSSVTKVGEYVYDAFGEIESSNGPALIGQKSYLDQFNYLYTGQEYDAELGLYNFRARMYSPSQKVFLQVDPLHVNYSSYLYANNDPINFVDTDGKAPVRLDKGFIVDDAEVALAAAKSRITVPGGSYDLMSRGLPVSVEVSYHPVTGDNFIKLTPGGYHYYYPYQSKGVGYMEIPKDVPNGIMAFTGGMNGCAMEIRSMGDYEVFYHDANGSYLKRFDRSTGLPGAEAPTTSRLDANDYLVADENRSIIEAFESRMGRSFNASEHPYYAYNNVAIKRGNGWDVYSSRKQWYETAKVSRQKTIKNETLLNVSRSEKAVGSGSSHFLKRFERL